MKISEYRGQLFKQCRRCGVGEHLRHPPSRELRRRQIGVALAAIVVGIIMTFFLPWVGIPIGVAGLLLLIAFLAGWGRRATQSQP